MKTSRRELGDLGEDVAAGYLSGLGHTVIERNWTAGHLEIDIVTLASDGVHFVEVKSRTAPVSADPEENVTAVKRKRLCRAALRYLGGPGYGKVPAGAEIFFDIVAVVFNGDSYEIKYYPQAFIPLYV